MVRRESDPLFLPSDSQDIRGFSAQVMTCNEQNAPSPVLLRAHKASSPRIIANRSADCLLCGPPVTTPWENSVQCRPGRSEKERLQLDHYTSSKSPGLWNSLAILLQLITRTIRVGKSRIADKNIRRIPVVYLVLTKNMCHLIIIKGERIPGRKVL